MGWVPLPLSRLAIQNSWPLSRHVWPLSRHVWPFSRHALPFYGTCHLFCFFPLPTLHNLHPGSIFMFIFLPSLRWSGVGKGFFCAALPLPLALGLAPLGCAGILASHHQSSQFPHPFLHCCCFCCSCCWSWTCSPLCLPNHGCKKWCGVSGASARCKQSHNCLAQKNGFKPSQKHAVGHFITPTLACRLWLGSRLLGRLLLVAWPGSQI